MRQLVLCEERIIGYFDDEEQTLDEYLKSLDPDSMIVPTSDQCTLVSVSGHPRNYRSRFDGTNLVIEEKRAVKNITSFNSSNADELMWIVKLLILIQKRPLLSERDKQQFDAYLNQVIDAYGGLNTILNDVINSDILEGLPT